MANNALCKFYAANGNNVTVRAVNPPANNNGSATKGSGVNRSAVRRFESRHNFLPSARSRIRRLTHSLKRRVGLYHLLLLPAIFLLLSELPTRLSNSSLSTAVFVRQADVRPGVSIVAVCMNRHNTLRSVLSKWKQVNGVDEIVIVDWSSDPPLRSIVQGNPDPRIKLIRVNGEPEWVLSRAYNLAIGAASRENVIRTDCDYALGSNFVNAHPFPKDASSKFYAGNYRLARTSNEVHLNGAVFIRRKDFFKVGGYDERIQTYGWDDEDLYTRLSNAGVSKGDVNYEHVSHVPHDDKARAQRDVRFVQVEIDLNRILLGNLNDSWSSSHMASIKRWAVDPKLSSPNDIVVSAAEKPRNLKQLNAPEKYEAAWKLALEQRLANDYQVPWDVLVYLDTPSKRKLLNRLNGRAARRPEHLPPRLLFVHCMHGLGNRLRALGSAMSFANATDRELVVIWETDAHISARFTDLFDSNHVVLPKMKVHWPFEGISEWDASWNHFEFINYMEMEGHGAVKDKWIVDVPNKHMYFKSAYIMNAPQNLTSWELDNQNLRSLTPVVSVRDRMKQLENAGLRNMVGVHIRDRTLDRDIRNVNFKSEYGDKASEVMEYWRKKSSHLNFIKEMHRIVKEQPDSKFYVATDTVKVMTRLKEEFGDRITTTERDCDGRDGFCIRYALIDILALGGTKKLLGSNWSSFTEAAERFGGKKALLAGLNFARDAMIPSR